MRASTLRRGAGRALVAGAVAAAIALGAIIVWSSRGRHEADTSGEESVAPPNRLRAAPGQRGDEAAIVLGGAERDRAGIATRVASGSSAPRHVRLTGELIANPSRQVDVLAPVGGRLTDAGGSGHWPALGDRVAAGAVLGQVSDALPLTAARGGIVTHVGAQPGEMVQAGQELLEITDFAEPLARVVWSADAPGAAPRDLSIEPSTASPGEASASVPARLVGQGATVDSLTRAPVYLYRLSRAWPGARPGAPIVALVPEPRSLVSGVFVPGSAVVQWQGLPWVYVQHGPNAYVRMRIDASHPVPGGWITALGVAQGDTIVVQGAQVLLSEEFRSRLSVGED
ncbi:MAG TPA: HlyD family efflux transporter periplasmic adaptor subunit [Gemmatimonadaceae bacterium]|nr:HlyD family efflux transporter periplasmic adaptor subunit [Gemmatimonadaceae bacterium]